MAWLVPGILPSQVPTQPPTPGTPLPAGSGSRTVTGPHEHGRIWPWGSNPSPKSLEALISGTLGS